MNMDMIIGGGTRKEFIDAGVIREIEAAALATANQEEEKEETEEEPTQN